jgi:coproporphyrinogen III oxidase
MLVSYQSEFSDFIRDLQDRICAAVENMDGEATFREDTWQREQGGGGRTRIIAGGQVFEKGGVNTSEVYGRLPDSMVDYLKVAHADFFACGISLVLHPHSPLVPTTHANYRYFELYNPDGVVVDQWFAGGADLTPYYLFDEDAAHFHQVQKTAADRFDPTYYPRFKQACDQYFRNPHRDEGRGVGGTFFDYLRPTPERDGQHWKEFTMAMAEAFVEAYLPIVARRKALFFEKKQKYWQEIRRGRYVEFNLIHDKGTLFGLKTNGRIESILMSLPPTVRWDYDVLPEPNSPEARLIEVLRQPKDWV